ncbi:MULTISPECIES: hypothetical protein [unclassified Pseudonocardia]|uniref:hypothetical protein n=1 Tax=unclassified Pseudonocardia TaxID=2619320 RepID=UPI000966D0AE|nr:MULTISPECIES: hypothetical protein [unclassified Pseudonocardia]OLM20160.1 hypothetical protein Ae707Ps1_4419c [Pseudonocardia sp. Ae707_Ps1]
MAQSHDGAAAPGPSGRRATPDSSTPSAAVLTPPTGLPSVTPSAPPRIPQQRTAAEPVAPAPPAQPGVAMCTCGHPEEMHEHYRSGSDCGACGARACGAFRSADETGSRARPRNPLRTLLRRRG